MDKVIKFYSVNDDYGEFSNFALYPIKIKGKKWPTSEHYFQAMKFESNKDQKDILNAKTPMEAARKGRDRKRKIKRNWESMKESVMRDALIAKFNQHASLRALLLATNDAKLIEHTENDAYWGDGGDGKGKNRLGILLMKVREEIS
jgi:N-glycosidase YbiA